jgi:hypothetical protein
MQYVYSGILWYYITYGVLAASDWRLWDVCGWRIMSVGKRKGHGLFSGTVLSFAQSKDGEPTACMPTVMCIMNLLGISTYIDVPPYCHMKTEVLGSQDQQRNIHPLPVRYRLNGSSVLFWHL